MCHNITELHKKIGKKIKKTFNITNKLKGKKLKAKVTNRSLAMLRILYTKKFNKYEQERKEREIISINNLTEMFLD